MTQQLAVDGGSPVRPVMLPYARGASLLGDEERDAVLKVLDSRSLFRYYGPDPQRAVGAFEDAVAARLAVPHAIAVSSGTAALRCALAALGVGCGDEVIVPAFTFIASVNAIVLAGAVPVFAEIDDTLNLDPADVAGKITSRTAAVMPVHLENVAVDMDSLLAVTGPAGLAVIEDAAQALGTSWHGRSVGTIGAIGAFSLQMEKNVTAGEGGIVTTDDETLALRAGRYQDQGGQFVTQHGSGRGSDLELPFVGENLRMTEIGGAIAGVQLGRLDGVIASLRASWIHVSKAVGDIDGLQPRRVHDLEGSGCSSLTWFVPTPEIAAKMTGALLAEGVPSATMYDGRPVYTNPAILARRTASGKGGPWNCAEHPTEVSYALGMCPTTEDLVARSVTVGIGAGWSESDCDDAAEAITKVASALIR